MRVVTYNLRHGAPPGRWCDHRGVARSLRELRADLYALQEVDRRALRSLLRDQTLLAARATATEGHFAPTRSMGPGGSYGNALLVRGRTLGRSVVPLPSHGEPRVALFARVCVGDLELTAVSTHLQNRRAGRADEAEAQLEFVLGELARWPEPWALCGDLNLRAPSVVPLLTAAGLVPVGTGPTYPSPLPRIRIDWIALRGLEVLDASVPDLRTSDHRPVLAHVRSERADGTGDVRRP